MIIEYLKFEVEEKFIKDFLEADKLIWTKFLKVQNGFINKETWLNPQNNNEIISVIWWQSLEQWKSISNFELELINSQFSKVFKYPFGLIVSKYFESVE